MEAVLQPRGLPFHLRPISELRIPFQRLKPQIAFIKPRSLRLRSSRICEAKSTAVADGKHLFGKREDPDFSSIDAVTPQKIMRFGLMFLCTSFNYLILRDIEEVLVSTAKGSSAKIIPFLETWVKLQMGFNFMFLCEELANPLSKRARFNSVMVPSIPLFGVFGFVLNPQALWGNELLGMPWRRFFGPLVPVDKQRGSTVISALFRGFANQTTTGKEKNFCTLPNIGANVALLYEYSSKNLGPGVDVVSLMSILGTMGIAICGLYWWVNRSATKNSVALPSGSRKKSVPLPSGSRKKKSVPLPSRSSRKKKSATKKKSVPLPSRSRKKKEEPKMGTMESSKFSGSSYYIRCLAILAELKAQVKGKAAIDDACNPLGKSGGALNQQLMIFLIFGSLTNSTPYLGGKFMVIALAWLAAAKSLGSQ